MGAKPPLGSYGGHNSERQPLTGIWRFKAYPTAGEGVAWFDAGQGPGGEDSEETPADEKLQRSLRRSKTTMRRYLVANGLTMLWGLTYAPNGRGCWERAGEDVEGRRGRWCSCGRPLDRAAARWGLEPLVRRLRSGTFKGRNFPYAAVAEPHKDGHWHLHIALGRFVAWQVMEAAWQLGSVGINGHSRTRASAPGARRAEARKAANYLGKYLAKTWDAEGEDQDPGDLLDGHQRYWVGQGFSPLEVEGECHRSTVDDGYSLVLRALVGRVRGPVERLWDSAGEDDWKGPRTLVLVFGDGK